MELNNSNAELYTFAVWGRVFEWDNEPASPPVVDDNVTEDGTESVTEESSDNDDQNVPGSSVVATTSKTLMLLAISLLFLRK